MLKHLNFIVVSMTVSIEMAMRISLKLILAMVFAHKFSAILNTIFCHSLTICGWSFSESDIHSAV